MREAMTVHKNVENILSMNEKVFTHTPKISRDKSKSRFLVCGRAKNIKGFLITEVILSLFVLTIGLTTTIALISSSLRQSFDNRDTIIAVELAQEGVELVRNVRDNGFINGPGTPPGPFYKFRDQKHCRIDYTVDYTADLDCTGSLRGAAYYALAYTGGFYKHIGAVGKFFRYVYIDYNNASETATVKSFVYWGGLFTPPNSGGSTADCIIANKCVFTEIFLTNWRP